MASPLSILFVEDERDLRALMMGMLSAAGFRVFVAADGYDAVRILAAHHIDLLFTDVVMPGMDGVQLASQAKLMRPGIKILFATGCVQRATERGAMRLGRLLYKPLRQPEVIREVEAVLGVAA
jgi:CheY-like chemotaxis protein